MSAREDRAKSLALCNDGKNWDDLRAIERDVYRKQAEREGFTSEPTESGGDPTNGAGYVAKAMRSRLEDLSVLVIAGIERHPMAVDAEQLEAVGVEVSDSDEAMADSALEALDQYPLAVERTVCFEIVLGTGGPDDRIVLECDQVAVTAPAIREGKRAAVPIQQGYEIRHVLYRYSWEGSGEIALSGDDREVAEEFARRVVPELIE